LPIYKNDLTGYWRIKMIEQIQSRNYMSEMDKLYFHDSRINKVSFDADRKCELVIDYYNWEGNTEGQGIWQWRRLKIAFGFLAVFEWTAPDLLNKCSEILEVKYDEKLEELYGLEAKIKQKYVNYESPLFGGKNILSTTFYLSNFSEDVFGYLRLIGSNVSIEWIDEDSFQGQIHIPMSKV
jgi:hypothetical protein